MKSITKLSRIILIYMNHFKLRIGKSTVLSRILTGAGLSGADASRVHHKSMPGHLLCKSSGPLVESNSEAKGDLIGSLIEGYTD